MISLKITPCFFLKTFAVHYNRSLNPFFMALGPLIIFHLFLFKYLQNEFYSMKLSACISSSSSETKATNDVIYHNVTSNSNDISISETTNQNTEMQILPENSEYADVDDISKFTFSQISQMCKTTSKLRLAFN